MPTNRTPIDRRRRAPRVTLAAVKIFVEMRRCACTFDPEDRYDKCAGCERWWELHKHLSRELHCKPWEFPAIENPDAGNPELPGTHNYERWRPDERGRALWRALDTGAREMRRAERARRRAEAAAPSSPEA